MNNVGPILYRDRITQIFDADLIDGNIAMVGKTLDIFHVNILFSSGRRRPATYGFYRNR